jgi:RimJ/RimL family protein N-acetyltransferase
MWQVCELTERSPIYAYLETDRLYATYLIGDLEPGMYEQCRWVGARAEGRLHALALLYGGLTPPPLVLMGDRDGLHAILEGDYFPEQVYLTCRPENLDMTRALYAWERETLMWRMVLPPARFRHVAGDCVPLTPAHAEQLTRLFTFGGGLAFSPEQIARGVFYGVFIEDQIVAVAGTHLVSPTYGVAGIGNIFVHPDCRGRGYGTAATSAVANELLRRGIRDVVLNVDQDNAPAIHVYEKLGFECYCPFYEGPAVRVGEGVSPRRRKGRKENAKG